MTSDKATNNLLKRDLCTDICEIQKNYGTGKFLENLNEYC